MSPLTDKPYLMKKGDRIWCEVDGGLHNRGAHNQYRWDGERWVLTYVCADDWTPIMNCEA